MEIDEEYKGMHLGATGRKLNFARYLRDRETEAEIEFWEVVRAKRLMGLKFRRQHALGDYIVDFYCHKLRLAIEIDGEYHESTEQKAYDKQRDLELSQAGVTIIRFSNKEVLEEPRRIDKELRSFIKKLSGSQ